MLPAVVGRREHCNEGPACKPLEAVHDALMCPDDHAKVVLLQELLDSVGSELDDIA